MTPLELLEQLNLLDEHSQIEAKTASEVGKSALETVCAFANEPGLGGGWLLLGAALDESSLFRQYIVTGLDDPDKISRDFSSQCAGVFNKPVRVQITSGLVNGKNLLAVYVPEAEAAEKPIYFQNKPLPGGAFRRVGSSDVRCTDDDLAVFYQERRGDSYDSSILRDADISALDPAAIAEYRRLRSASNPAAEELRWTDEELLHALHCVDRDGTVLRPTVAGVFLFGTTQALRRWFPMMRVDYIRVPGREWIPDPEQRFETIELRAPLIPLVQRARAAILDDLPKAFSLPPGEIHRKDIPLIPDRVIREAVVNAVMHRSYRVHGAVQIIRYANRIEIRNPGHSLVSEDRLGEPGSETRNPIIAAVLHDMNLAETKGSGIRVMRQLMDESGLTPPTFESDRERNQFVVTFLFHHFLSPEDWAWLRTFHDAELTNEQARALVFVREAGAITNAALRSISHVDVLTASQHLRRLRQFGLLQQKGKGAQTYYIPTEKLLAPWQNRQKQAAPQVDDETNNLKTRDLQKLAAALGISTPQVTQQVAQQVTKLLKTADGDVKSRSQLQSSIGLQDREHFRKFYIEPLIKSGWLAYTIPDKPTSRLQKYCLTEKGKAWLDSH